MPDPLTACQLMFEVCQFDTSTMRSHCELEDCAALASTGSSTERTVSPLTEAMSATRTRQTKRMRSPDRPEG